MNLANEHEYNEENKESCCCTGSSLQQFNHSPKQQKIDPGIAEALAKNLNGLSLDEREKILEDMHCCVGEKSKEEPTLITASLHSLEKEVEKIRGSSRVAYDLAMRMDPQYVQHREFRLMFLRADEFIEKNAAKRMLLHFTSKLELFGEEKLVRDITFDDLSAEDKRAVNTGSHQFLGVKDSKERTVVFIFSELNATCSRDSFARAQWYQWMGAADEESTQLNGVILVSWWNSRSVFNKDYQRANQLMRTSLPIRLAAFHMCFINQNMPAYMRIVLDILGKRNQARARFHLEDSSLSGLYTLQSFGINPGTVPLGNDGRPQRELFLKLIENRITCERERRKKIFKGKAKPQQETDTQSLIRESITPTSKDILLGRCKLSTHPGNLFLEKLIEMKVHRYQQATTRFEKTCIVMTIIKHIEESGGRFLIPNKKKKNPDGKSKEWFIVDSDAVQESVAAKFRYKKKKQKKNSFYYCKTEHLPVNMK